MVAQLHAMTRGRGVEAALLPTMTGGREEGTATREDEEGRGK